jgi:hypothetical protein
MTQLLNQHNGLIESLKRRDEIIQGTFDNIEGRLKRHRQAINTNSSDLDLLQSEHESLVDKVLALESEQSQFEDAADRLSDLSYGEPPRTSTPHQAASPIPIPIPPPATSGEPSSSGLPNSEEDSPDTDNSVPRTEQSSEAVRVLVPIEEFDPGAEVGYVIGRQFSEQLVSSVLNQRCKLKAHPSRKHLFHPYPRKGEGRDFPFDRRARGEQHIGGGDRERFRRTRRLREGLDGDADIESDYSTDGSRV